MPLKLRLRTDTTIPVVVDEINWPNIRGMSVLEVAKRQIWFGRHRQPLGELFEVRGSVDDTTIWQGNLESVHWIGARLQGGRIVLEGNAGRHVGSQMRSGEIIVQGNTSDFVGCEMTGGSIRVDGSTGDWIGSAYPGTASGMQGGRIEIRGDSGNAVGNAMRRGIIWLHGTAGDLVGWNMRAGTIIVGGGVGDQTGLGMVRGTIVLTGQQQLDGDGLLMPTFKRGGKFRPAFLQMLRQSRIRTGQTPVIAPCEYALYHGDMRRGGKGEIFIAVR